MDENKQDELLRLLRGLHDEMRALRKRVESLEASQPKRVVTEETVAILSSAIAAYLGVKPRIRQIRLIRSESWPLQGRATIHASHALNR
jgi:methylmalonyl-CoA carboxyltransferase large subunit